MGYSFSGLNALYDSVNTDDDGEVWINENRFKVVRQLGEGGFAFVYLVKEVLPDDGGALASSSGLTSKFQGSSHLSGFLGDWIVEADKQAWQEDEEVIYNEVEQGDVYGNELIEYEEEGAEMRKGLLEQLTYAGVEPADADPVQVATDDEIDFSFCNDDLRED